MFNFSGKNYIGKSSQINEARQPRPPALTGIYSRIGTGHIGKLMNAAKASSKSEEHAEPV
ncbi:MAG: hypothetical protein PHX38_09345 [Sulfuricella sp.]|jgi:hypothetical protein|nr:hypothetical protein [Sulfuricella sp.]